jgi:hypothetical protein
VHTRKGSIMEYNGIGFEEGPWPQKAYWDAMGRARERDAGTYIDYGWTRPKVISRGEIPQVTPGVDAFQLEGMPGAEEVQSPEPTPAEPRTGEDTLPGPGPSPMPLETRARPISPSQPRVSSAGSAGSTDSTNGESAAVGTGLAQSGTAQSTTEPTPATKPAATITVKPVKQVAPATFQSGASPVSNPLRSGGMR